MNIGDRLEKMFYNRCPSRKSLDLGVDIQIVTHVIVTNDNIEISLFQLIPQNCNPEFPVVLHYHGNYGDVVHHSKYIMPLLEMGLEVWMWDYRGYGFTKGKQSHELIMHDSIRVYNECYKSVVKRNRKLIILGQSLGGHLAICLTEKIEGLSGLVFDCAFSSFSAIAKYRHPIISWISKHIVNQPYSALTSVGKLQLPVMAMHAQFDLSVPFRMGVELYNKLPAVPKRSWWYPGGHLHSHMFVKAMQNEMSEFLKLL